VFLDTSLAELERRLRERGTETEATIRRRLASAREELAHAPSYHYRIRNESPDDLAAATAELRAIIAGLFARTRDAG
jgi:guanylate kinase